MRCEIDLDAVLPASSSRARARAGRPRPRPARERRFAADFVVEMEQDGRRDHPVRRRRHGRRPTEGETFVARYRIGVGPSGNVGARALTVLAGEPRASRCRNPMPAIGGHAPEPLEHVRLYAPQAFRRQERAVTAADYAAAAERHPEVAAGGRHPALDRQLAHDVRHRRPLRRSSGRRRVRGAAATHLDRFRLAGYDVEIDAPKLVAIDLKLWLCLASDASRTTVARAVRAVLREHFDPDKFTFGQAVYLAPVIAKAMASTRRATGHAEGLRALPRRDRRGARPDRARGRHARGGPAGRRRQRSRERTDRARAGGGPVRAGLDTCGCAPTAGAGAEPRIFNPPGLDALDYRIGTHPTVLRRLLAAIPRIGASDDIPGDALARLTTRTSTHPRSCCSTRSRPSPTS